MPQLLASTKSVTSSILNNRYALFLGLILGLGLVLRINGLTVQSLWIDELHTVQESRPDNPVSLIMDILQKGIYDPHPPLYFLLIHYWFKLVGFSDFTARLFSALAGTLSIYAVYTLARELFNRNAGLIAALLTAVNFNHLYYSQEARNYIFSFVLTCFSFYFLIKCIKKPAWGAHVGYGITTLLLLYCHYYGFAVLGAQIVIIASVLLLDRQSFGRRLLRFSVSGLIVLAGFAPWIPVVLKMGEMSSFWISKPQTDFFITYFAEYFGYQSILVYTFAFLLIVFFATVVLKKYNSDESQEWLTDKLLFSFFILMTWTVVSYLIPYVRSLVATPMLFGRYTIVTLPAILIAIAIGMEHFTHRLLKVYVLVFVLLITGIDLFIVKEYYVTPTKQQFREAVDFVVSNGRRFPIITDQGGYYKYYFEKAGHVPEYVTVTPDYLKNHHGSIWVLSCWNTTPAGVEGQKVLDSLFTVSKEFSGIDTWAKLYSPQGSYVRPEQLQLQGGSVLPDGVTVMWGNSSLSTAPLVLDKGQRQLVVEAYGTAVDDVNAHVKIYLNNKLLADYYLTEQPEKKSIDFEVSSEEENVFRVEFDNDAFGSEGNDRNAFIKSLEII